MSCVIVKEDAVQISSSVRPVDCVSQKVTCVTVTMTVEITRMKSTVNMVNVMMLGYFRPQSSRRLNNAMGFLCDDILTM